MTGSLSSNPLAHAICKVLYRGVRRPHAPSITQMHLSTIVHAAATVGVAQTIAPGHSLGDA
ncbi:hypothetical protein BN2476_270026 [Paraburkholderia piptadeniae]|uniref:Uncharacterized protein n=1 Tax=Paraburkholderia piptadeniae TaxID=1701573 RepID=A0A1N7S1H3_9BURK|nr:hypothetical protein BN2476_270026 [Paraburkholderia piptadeniae]